jgi:YVTN family beta-propeller protein
MINKHKLFSIALMSVVIILMLISITSAVPFTHIKNNRNIAVSTPDPGNKAITATVPVGKYPYRVAVTPDVKKLYVTNYYNDSVSVIDTATNHETSTVRVGRLLLQL